MKKYFFKNISNLFLLLIVFGLIIFLFVSKYQGENNTIRSGPQRKFFAIAPHFMIAPKKVDEFYHYLQKKYPTVKNIVVISPNHFNLGEKQFETFCEKGKLCFKNQCIEITKSFTGQLLGCGKSKKTSINTFNLFEKIDVGRKVKDHGIGEHIKRVNKHFTGAHFFPIVIKQRQLDQNNNLLIEELNKFPFNGDTLFIASVDFSHHVSEPFAEIHDRKAIYTLNNSNTKNDYKGLEVDCQSCLYTINRLANNQNQGKFSLRYRDSSALIVGYDNDFDNTSRLFMTREKNDKKPQNGITIAFFGDLMYDRGVKKNLSDSDKIKKFFTDYFQQGDLSKNPNFYIHRKLFGFDFVGLNLETPVVSHPNECQQSSKSVRFCSDEKILPTLKQIGFNVVNIANNHAMDGGKSAYYKTKELLEKNGITSFGTINQGIHQFENINTGIVRGAKVARHGYDFVINQKGIETYCKTLQSYKKNGYMNLIAVHRGYEYHTGSNSFQKRTAKKLIDCGAEVIIGSHPHVVQEIERYKNKPIIYSLGNFLFDQDMTDDTKKGGFILIDIPLGGKIKILTGSVISFVESNF